MRHRIWPADGHHPGQAVWHLNGLAHRSLRAHHLMPTCRRTSNLDSEDDWASAEARLIKAMNLSMRNSGRCARRCGTSTARKMKWLRPHHIFQSYGNSRSSRPGRRSIRSSGALRPRRRAGGFRRAVAARPRAVAEQAAYPAVLSRLFHQYPCR